MILPRIAIEFVFEVELDSTLILPSVMMLSSMLAAQSRSNLCRGDKHKHNHHHHDSSSGSSKQLLRQQQLRQQQPAASGPPLGEIGRSGSATATVLAGDVLMVERHDGGATLNIGIGWIATDDSSQVLVGFIRDEGLGQTYAIVRREDDGMVVRRWIEPDSADVYAVPWADVFANYNVPTDVIISIPLDDRHPAQLMLARRFDGGDDRILVHIGNGVWSHIPDYPTFEARGFLWENVTAADSDYFNRINIGAPLPSSGG